MLFILVHSTNAILDVLHTEEVQTYKFVLFLDNSCRVSVALSSLAHTVVRGSGCVCGYTCSH